MKATPELRPTFRSRAGRPVGPGWTLALVLALAVQPATGPRALDEVAVQVGAAAFQVEVAQTDAERHRGLMFRRSLPADRGMLFVQAPGRAEFWMKNTLIPLDLLFFDTDGTLLQVLPEVQPCRTPRCPTYPSDSAAVAYILEINAGEAGRRAIRVGDGLRFPP